MIDKVIIVIPARYGSTRLPGKMLADIAGKPLVLHTYDCAKLSALASDCLIATDDGRISDVCVRHGAKVIMTSHWCQSGTERTAEIAIMPNAADIYVNVQGDEPFINPDDIDRLIEMMCADPSIKMGTLKRLFDPNTDSVGFNTVGVICDDDDCAVWFGRNTKSKYVHIGVYIFRRDFLIELVHMPQSALEKREGLEQLRALDAGVKIKVLTTTNKTVGVDTIDDLKLVREMVELEHNEAIHEREG